MSTLKAIIAGIFALVLVTLTAASAFADPYDGVNRIGTYYQYTNTVAYDHQLSYGHYYDYIAPPRAGGFFGSTSAWLTGLRSPIYTPVPPVHYTNYYQPVCGYPCYFGGSYGYPRARASDFPVYRARVGDVFSY